MTANAGSTAAMERHGRSLVVWDLPPTIDCGGTFRVHVGVKCEAACPPADWVIEVRDHDGRLQATAIPDPVPWQGTESLHAAAVELVAPASAGRYRWEVVVPALHVTTKASATAQAPAHEAAATEFPIRVVTPADCRLEVVAVDRETGTPVGGARVVAHPYRTVTDDQGRALLRAPKGRYRLFVSGTGYLPLRLDGELGEDGTIRAELEPDRGPSDAEIWS